MIVNMIKFLIGLFDYPRRLSGKAVPVLVLKKATPGCEAVKRDQVVVWLSKHSYRHNTNASIKALWEQYIAEDRDNKGETSKACISLSQFRRAATQALAHSSAVRYQAPVMGIEQFEACKQLEAKLFSPEILPSLLPMLVSFDTAVVRVWIRDHADAPAKQARLHVAGAISTQGCWLCPSTLALICAAQDSANYNVGHFMEVLDQLQDAVSSGDMPVQTRSPKAITGLRRLLQNLSPGKRQGKQQEDGAAGQAGRQHAALAQRTLSTRHYKCRTRGRRHAAFIQNKLAAADAKRGQLQPFVLLFDGASQHTCAPAVDVLLRTGQSAIHLASRRNPIELLWDDLKEAAAAQEYRSETHAMQGLVALWSSMAPQAAAAMKLWGVPAK